MGSQCIQIKSGVTSCDFYGRVIDPTALNLEEIAFAIPSVWLAYKARHYNN